MAQADNDIIGFARSGPWLGRCAYAATCETSVYIDRAHHGRGLGRTLYDALLGEVDRRGFHSAIGGIALPNEASVALHEAMGYVHVGTFAEVGFKFDRWRDVGYWQRVNPDCAVVRR